MKHTLRPRPGSKRRSLASRKGAEAFSLVELIVGVAVGAVVLGSIGGLALISEMRYNRNSLVSQSLRDSWSRSLAFISSEASQAYWIRTSLTTPPGYPCAGGQPQNPLVLDGPPNPDNPDEPIWRVVYGVRSNAGVGNQWRGVNRLVRCGPPFERVARSDTEQTTREEALRAAAIGGNLSFADAYQETTIADQLPAIAPLPCPVASVPGPCAQPFYARVFNTAAPVDREAQVNLFLSRPTGATFPPAANSGFHALIRANRNPGFSITGDPSCNTTTDSWGNEVPNDLAACRRANFDSMSRWVTYTTHNLATKSGSLRINSCGPNCNGPRLSDTFEIIYLPGRYADYTTNQFSATDDRPCSRKSCFLQNGSQSVQIYDGNMLIFYDRIVRF